MTEQIIDFIPLNDYPDYEILNEYPFIIRRKDNKYVIKETINKCNGYPSVCLNTNKINKHTIIAKQFILNDDPENKNQVDHINKDRTDYHLENLRWVSSSENNKNASSRNGVQYEFIDSIPYNAIKILYYDTSIERHFYNDGEYYYYFDEETEEDKFYQKITNNVFRVMHINTTKNGLQLIMTRDINHKKVSIYLHSFKHQYNQD